MRILHLSPHLSAGGAERQLNLLVPEFAKLGHEVHIAYLFEGPEHVQIRGGILHRLDVIGNYDPQLLLKLFWLIRTIKPQVMQSWILMMDILGGILTTISNTHWIMREPSSDMAYKNPNFKHKLRGRLGHNAAAIVANSSGGRIYWLGQGIPEQRLHVITNAVPFGVIKQVKPSQDTSGIQNTVIYAGRLIPSKKVDMAIHAIAYVRRRQKVHFIIAGEGPAKPELIRLVHRLQLGEVVRFVSYMQPYDLWAHMKAAKVFISLSDYEGMPNCVTEAVACGVPVVLSNIPAHRNFLNDDSALFVTNNSITEITEAILRTLENNQEAAQRAAKAQDAIRDRTSAVVAAEYIALYERLVG